MQGDQSHTAQHMRLHAIRRPIAYTLMRRMSPPDKHIRPAKQFFGQSALRHGKRRTPDPKVFLFFHKITKAPVDPVRIAPADLLIFLFMDILIPNRHTDHIFVSFSSEFLFRTGRSNA
jgi:hypothetical protein